MKVIGKYSRISEADALEETYQHYAVKVMPRIPYPTTKGIQMVLDEMSSRNPKAKNLQPASFIDVTTLKELEQSGFIKVSTAIDPALRSLGDRIHQGQLFRAAVRLSCGGQMA